MGTAPCDLADRVAGILAVEAASPAVLTDSLAGADLVVYLRTSATLAGVADEAVEAGATPHLLVGAAWGDPPPPPAPVAAGWVALLSAHVAREIDKFAAGDRSLAGRTVALDLATCRSVDGALLRQGGAERPPPANFPGSAPWMQPPAGVARTKPRRPWLPPLAIVALTLAGLIAEFLIILSGLKGVSGSPLYIEFLAIPLPVVAGIFLHIQMRATATGGQ